MTSAPAHAPGGGDACDVVVVGAGPLGASAAKYLAASGAATALVGPGQAAGGAGDEAPFSSHDDVTRITRVVDPDPVWARLAARSVARYRRLEATSGVGFFTEAGFLAVAPASSATDGYLAALQACARATGTAVERHSRRSLAERLPLLSAPDDVAGLEQRQAAGLIDPRAFVRAQITIGLDDGLTLRRDAVTALDDGGGHVEVRTAGGDVLRAGRVLVAAGAYSGFPPLVTAGLAVRAEARTVVHAVLGESDAQALAAMPAIIVKPSDAGNRCYLLPPVRYPDGTVAVKVGDGASGRRLSSTGQLARWFRSAGDPDDAARLTRLLRGLVPHVRPLTLRSQPCAVTTTASSRPVIDLLPGGRVGVLTGGNGYAAKSADELGRLGAAMVAGDDGWAAGHGRSTFALA